MTGDQGWIFPEDNKETGDRGCIFPEDHNVTGDQGWIFPDDTVGAESPDRSIHVNNFFPI